MGLPRGWYTPRPRRGCQTWPRIVAYRNVLVHGYAVNEDELVLQVAVARVPQLGALLQQLLDASDGS
jgi:uncharacterized protein with HEPN domain